MWRIGVVCAALVVVLGVWWKLGEREIARSSSEVNGQVIVTEGRGLRALRFSDGGSTQTVVKVGEPLVLVAPYYRVVVGGLRHARADAGRFLVVGMGGGALPTYLHGALGRPVLVDSVEYDPVVVQAARKWFAFSPSITNRVHVEDGAAFVQRVAVPYDFVVLDAFGALDYPPHLVTKEFFEAVSAAVRPDGVVAANLLGPGINREYYVMLARLRAVFPRVEVEPVPGRDQVIVFAFKREV